MAAKKTAKKKKAKALKAEAPPDIRASLEPTAANMEAVLKDVEASLAGLTPPGEPCPSDLVSAMLHITFADGMSCGVGQEACRRIEAGFVDRNEFRLTEAFEVEAMLADLEIPRLFTRCGRARESIAEIYNDQNAITLEFLREASVTDRNMFFERTPVLKPGVVHFVVSMMSFEEIVFSDRSTMRLQQRLGFDPKDQHVTEFIVGLRELIRPFGHLPIYVGPDSDDGKPIESPQLSAACHVVRLAPPPKRK